MRANLFNEFQRIRNEFAHGPTDAAELIKSLIAWGVQMDSEDLNRLLPAMRNDPGQFFVPSPVLSTIAALVQDRKASVICDPWAGAGTVIATVKEATGASHAFAVTPTAAAMALGKHLIPDANWQVGDPLKFLDGFTGEIDVVASVLPFGAKTERGAALSIDGRQIALPDDLSQAILAGAAARLSREGIGIFVTPSSLFMSRKNVRMLLGELDSCLDAAFFLPSGAFAPATNIATYVVIVRRGPGHRMFVAQLSGEAATNKEIFSNYKKGIEAGSLELGRFVDPLTFSGLESIRLTEQFDGAQQRFGVPAIPLDRLASGITLGRPAEDFEFPASPNAVYIPLVGNSDVVESTEDLKLKRQNYAQVQIDAGASDARFVARFLNSEFGREIRERTKTGAFIPKLNKQNLTQLPIFVPDIGTQQTVLELETRITAEQNTVLGLQNELADLRRELWANLRPTDHVRDGVRAIGQRLSGGAREYASKRLDQWFETLPFPLASILRAWQATSNNDFKTKQEHLLHFFEATAEFISVILLSAFGSNVAVFEPHKEKLKESYSGPQNSDQAIS